ncbi:hypothetical protein ACGFZK_32555 [Streptomyces sp. NPDC048257]|uniref:hypothetical protein n=1 Tax=Streptomyces sp. NPDC048257 TaxID=3365526 RepID=UPI003721DA9C
MRTLLQVLAVWVAVSVLVGLVLACLGYRRKSRRKSQPPAVHIGGRANAETCPACSGTALPWPFICPGPDTPTEPTS